MSTLATVLVTLAAVAVLAFLVWWLRPSLGGTFWIREPKVVIEVPQKVVEDATIHAPGGQQARAIDPNNPPKWMTWKGIDGRLNCTCHGDPIRTGQRILFWPIPGHPQRATDLFCERTVQEAKGAS